jgi:hypothetical protein
VLDLLIIILVLAFLPAAIWTLIVGISVVRVVVIAYKQQILTGLGVIGLGIAGIAVYANLPFKSPEPEKQIGHDKAGHVWVWVGGEWGQ